MRIKLDIPLLYDEISNLLNLEKQEEREHRTITHICTDSRICQSGDLFFSLAKNKEDALLHIAEARKAECYIAAEDWIYSNEAFSPQKSLLKLAAFYKKKLPHLKTTVAITGSIGKTTTKELLKALLSKKFTVHSTPGNFNNDLGMPITVLSAPANTEILILEFGMNHRGEILELTTCINPNIAIITCITSAHIGNLGTRADIARAKLEICESKCDELITIVPYEEPLLITARNRKTVSLTDPKANFFLFPLDIKKDGSIFDFYSESSVLIAKKIFVPGKHILSNTAFALAVASILKLSKTEIENGLESFSEIAFRQGLKTIGRFRIFDDTYSSSPEAASSMLKLLSLYEPRNKSALLGDMLELGDYSYNAHYNLGKEVFQCGFRKLYTYGNYSKLIANGAIDAGMPREKIFINEDKNAPEISARQIANSYEDELILFKASHGMNAERIYGHLKNF